MDVFVCTCVRECVHVYTCAKTKELLYERGVRRLAKTVDRVGGWRHGGRIPGFSELVN